VLDDISNPLEEPVADRGSKDETDCHEDEGKRPIRFSANPIRDGHEQNGAKNRSDESFKDMSQ